MQDSILFILLILSCLCRRVQREQPSPLSLNIREAELPALILVGQPFVVEAETMQDGRLQIVNVNLVLRDVEAQIVRRAVREAGASPGLAGEL